MFMMPEIGEVTCDQSGQSVLDKYGNTGNKTEDDKSPCVTSPDSDTSLDLSSQELVSLPVYVLKMHTLTHLYIDYNDLSTLPDNFGSVLPCLEVFSAVGNYLTHLPITFSSLIAMKKLYLSENNLTALHMSFSKLKSLKLLKLTGNLLKQFPENFGEITSLEALHADENNLTKLPATLGLLESLHTLEIGTNDLSHLPIGVGNLKSLKILNVSNNKLEALPESLGALKNLQIIDISTNHIEKLPSHCRSVRTLKKLYADHNVLQAVPEWVSDLSEVVQLSMKDNQFQGQVLAEDFAKTCKKLKTLDLAGNFMSRLPYSLGQLENLETLHLGSVIGELERRNFQNGNWLPWIPDSVCDLMKLTELHVDENQLHELPKNFGHLKNLEFLDVAQNMLFELPETFGQLRSLRICQLSKNHLQLLPSDFGNLTSLEDLRLDNNAIAELPESFSKLTNLKTLDLFNNKIHDVPSVIHQLKNLVRLDLEANNFRIPLDEIPQIITRSRYPPRDPLLKDNWRGRARQDLNVSEDEVIKLSRSEGAAYEEFEPPPKDLEYSEDLMRLAVQRNMSIWRSHSGPAERELFERKPLLLPGNMENGQVNQEEEDDGWEEEGEIDEEDDNFEPDENIDENSESAVTDPCRVTAVSPTGDLDCSFLPTSEDWDAEIDSSYNQFGSFPVYKHPLTTSVPATVSFSIENKVFLPFDIHSKPFSRQRLAFQVELGQFDDPDEEEEDWS